jgi:hypothetical protein
MKLLGIKINNTFSWKSNVDMFVPKLGAICFAVGTVRPVMSQETLMLIYSFIHSFTIHRSNIQSKKTTGCGFGQNITAVNNVAI